MLQSPVGQSVLDNVFMSLPTSLVHCILSDWVEVVSIIRLEFALGGCKSHHMQLLDLLKSNQFHASKIGRAWLARYYDSPRPAHPYTQMLNWCIERQLKVAHIELHGCCWHVALHEYLQKFGEHVRHICSREDNNRPYEELNEPTQNSLIAQYCHSLVGCFVNIDDQCDGNILRILNNNTRLEKLHINGSLTGRTLL